MAKPKPMPPLERLEYLFEADFDKGVLKWKNPMKHSGNKKGDIAGHKNNLGYIKVSVDKKLVSVHRVIWALFYRKEPPPILDHINRVKDDNRIINLREADSFLNSQNQGIARHNKSGFKGICWHKHTKKYVVTKMVKGTDYYIGSFYTVEEAVTELDDWCKKRGIKYAISPQGIIPEEWLHG